MLSQKDLPKPTFAKLFHYFVFSKTARRVEVLAVGGIQYCLILNEFKVIFEVLCTFGIEQTQMCILQFPLNVFKCLFSLYNFELKGLGFIMAVGVDVNLN